MPRIKICTICWKENNNTMSKCCSPLCERKHRTNLNKLKKEKETVKKEKTLDKKRFSRSNLIKECDRVWSIYIRERDKWKPCITCGEKWTETMNAGHFQSRRHLNTRWEAQNWAGQCVKCNNWWCGEQFEFAIALNNRSPWLAEQLRRLANDTSKTTDEEILTYIRGYYYELSQMWWTNEQIKIKKYYL